MTTGIWSAASGATGRTIALDVAANNIANASTPGFRADQTVFGEELARAGGLDAASATHRFSAVQGVETSRGPGRFEPTGRLLDVAIRDENTFFAVSTPAGERYTRAGNVQLGADGTLITPNGQRYLGSNGQPIAVPPDAGEVAIQPSGDVVVGELTFGRLLTVRVDPGSALVKEGDVLFRTVPGAARPTPVDPALEIGTLELSNVSAIKTMSTLVNATREFDMMTRVIDAFSAIERSAATSVMKGR